MAVDLCQPAQFPDLQLLLHRPYFSFHIADRSVVLTLLLFLAVAILTGNLAARLRDQVATQRDIAQRTANLYEFSRKIASAASFDDIVWAAVHHVASTLQCRSLVLRPGDDGGLSIAGSYPPEDELEVRDWGAAKWAWQHGEPAGWGSQTLPSSRWLFLPLRTAQGPLAVLGVSFEGGKQLDPENRRLLDALVDQVAVAIERAQLTADIEESRVSSETERLRAALLSSVSHDLRTPLVSIIGAATTLIEGGDAIGAQSRHQLAETIRQEGERLNRYVQNLLDMTRISYGALQLNKEWIEPRELVGRAVRQLKRELDGFQVTIDVPLLLPAIKGDPVLLEQAFVNVLDNAGKYAPAGSAIAISAERHDDGIAFAIDDQGPGIPVRTASASSTCSIGSARATGKARAPASASPSAGAYWRRTAGRSAPCRQERGIGTRIEIHLPLSDAGSACQEAADARCVQA